MCACAVRRGCVAGRGSVVPHVMCGEHNPAVIGGCRILGVEAFSKVKLTQTLPSCRRESDATKGCGNVS